MVSTEILAIFIPILFATSAIFSLILFCSNGSLLPVWMFINSFQLIAHVPLITSALPGNAHHLFLECLRILRLNFGPIDSWLRDLVGESPKHNAEMAFNSNDAFFYTTLINACGYSYSFWPNLILIFFLFALLMTFWLIAEIWAVIYRNISKNECRFQRSMNNCLVRFLYEVFFELVVCLMISSTYFVQGSDSASTLSWFAALAIFFLCSAALVFLTALLFTRYGPLKDDFYERQSCMSFLWQVRPIKQIQYELWDSKNKDKKSGVRPDAAMGSDEKIKVGQNQPTLTT